MSLRLAVGLAALWSCSAWALDEGVGRVLSVTRTSGTTVEVELEDVNASLFNNSDVEIFTPAGKVAAKLKLPPNIDMLMKGDKVKVTLELAGPFSPAGGLVAEKGKFANHAAISGALNATPRPAAPPPSAAPRVAVASCPFTPAELKTALGLSFKAGSASPDLPFAGGALKSCRYEGADGKTPMFTVNLTVMNDPTQTQGSMQALAGKTTPVPGDADGARWQTDQGDLTNPTLHYVRQGVVVELRINVGPKDPRFAALKDKLVRVRRVP